VSALDTLIRVHRHQLDERRQQVAELDRLSAKLREELQRLENEAAAEQRTAAASPEGAFGYGAYAAGVVDRRQKLLASLAEVEEQMAQAREALAAAFDVGQREVPELAAELRARFPGDPEYAARWAFLPEGSRPLANPLGGAPGFAIGNVRVLPGLPSEMEAMFDTFAEELADLAPIACWRASYRTTESRIVAVLEEAVALHPRVLVGSYPSFHASGSLVEVVLKSPDPAAVEAARAFVERALEAMPRSG